MAGKSTRTPEARFWEKVRKTKTCWLWTAATDTNGYGKFFLHGRLDSAHRVSWLLSGKQIAVGKRILHKCDTRACVRPSHLFEGTQLDNIRDMDRKGRRICVPHYGEDHGRAKLSNAQVLEIRRLRLVDQVQVKELVRRFRVSLSTIEGIIYNVTWRHLL